MRFRSFQVKLHLRILCSLNLCNLISGPLNLPDTLKIPLITSCFEITFVISLEFLHVDFVWDGAGVADRLKINAFLPIVCLNTLESTTIKIPYRSLLREKERSGAFVQLTRKIVHFLTTAIIRNRFYL